jgi:hypothetical protein
VIGEEQLFDHVADMIVVARVGGAAIATEVKRKIYVHHVAFTRICVLRIFNPVPVGAQTAWLSFVKTGVPPALTRVAALVHCALTQGPLPAVGGGRVQPATVYELVCVTIGWPPTLTRGLDPAACACPACIHCTVELVSSM